MEEDYLNNFYGHLRLKGCKSVTIDEYRTNLRAYTDYLTDCHHALSHSAGSGQALFAATTGTITDYYLAVKKKNYALKTIWKKQHAVYALYEWLQNSGFLLVNPCPRPVVQYIQELPRRVPDRATLVRTYTKLSESDKLWEQRDFSIIDLAYSCGLRRCELHALNVGDISIDEGTIQVTGKRGKKRIVPIGKKSLSNLLFYVYHIRPKLIKDSTTKALFVSWNAGKRMHLYSINAAFRRLRNKYGLDRSLVPHGLRHAYATDLVRNGAPVQDVAEMLGHVKLETTQIYTRLCVTDLKRCHHACHPRG